MKHQTLNIILTVCLLGSFRPVAATEPKVAPTDTVVIETSQWLYRDSIGSGGYCAYLSNNIPEYAVFRMAAYSNDNPFGRFTWEDGQMEESLCYHVSADTTDTTYLIDGELLVLDDGFDCTLTGWVMDEEGTYFQLQWNKVKQGPYAKDVQNEGFTAAFAESEITITDKQYGTVYINGEKTNEIRVSLSMHVDNCSSYLVPAGEYIISDIDNVGTVMASPGVFGTSVERSFAANLSSSNNITDRWYLVKGKVTVSYDENQLMTMTVAAENTCGQPVNVTFTKSFAGIDLDDEVRDSYGLIIRPAKGTAYRYWRSQKSWMGMMANGSMWFTSPQFSRTAFVECDNGTVYWYNPSYAMRYGYWIKGTKEGNSYVFPAGQFVRGSSSKNTQMCWVDYNADTIASARGTFSNDTVPFILDGVGTDTIRLRGVELTDGTQSTRCVGFNYSTNPQALPAYDFGMLFFRSASDPGLDILVPPADLKAERVPYYANSILAGEMRGSVLVGWDGNDVYIKGLGFLFPKTWIKGTLSGNQVIFPKYQYLGEYSSSISIWLCSSNIRRNMFEASADYVMSYDKKNKIFSSSKKLYLTAEFEEDDGHVEYAEVYGFSEVVIGYPVKEPTGLDNQFYRVENKYGVHKFLHNGQIIIRRGKKNYTIMGVEF